MSPTPHNQNEYLDDQQMSSFSYGNDLLRITGREALPAKTLPFMYQLHQISKAPRTKPRQTASRDDPTPVTIKVFVSPSQEAVR